MELKEQSESQAELKVPEIEERETEGEQSEPEDEYK